MTFSPYLKQYVQRPTIYQEGRKERENERETGSLLHSTGNSWSANGDEKINKLWEKKMYGLFYMNDFENIVTME